MNIDTPLVTIVMATYNRAHTIERAIKSVLNQTYKKLELVIVDDGSEDDTLLKISNFNDQRIRVLRHEVNRGVTAAKNTGLKNIRGDWFTTFDSDDEMLPDAIKTMLDVPLLFDNSISQVICNCVDANTGKWTARGLDKDCYVNANEIISFCEGEFWGLVKTDTLQGDLFNENLHGIESTLWYKINDRAKSYYIHKALNLIHTEGSDRVSKVKINPEKSLRHYESLIGEEFYLQITNKYRPDAFYDICKSAILFLQYNKRSDIAKKYYEIYNKYSKRSFMIELFYRLRILSLFHNYLISRRFK